MSPVALRYLHFLLLRGNSKAELEADKDRRQKALKLACYGIAHISKLLSLWPRFQLTPNTTALPERSHRNQVI